MKLRLAVVACLLPVIGHAQLMHGRGGGSPGTGPTPNSAAAAIATISQNPLCSQATLGPYWWEIGNSTAVLVSGQVGTGVNRTTLMSIDSASKWIAAAAAVQLIGAGNLTASDIAALNFTDGKTNMNAYVAGKFGGTQFCPNGGTVSGPAPYTVANCNTLLNTNTYAPANGQRYDYTLNGQSNPNPPPANFPITVNYFTYDSAHEQSYFATRFGAGNNPDIGDMTDAQLGPEISSIIFTPTQQALNAKVYYSQPLMAGGIATTAASYAFFLRNILSGYLQMSTTLLTGQTCTYASNPPVWCFSGDGNGNCATSKCSPINESQYYAMGHWIESEPTWGDGAYSSPGAQGFYPWVDATETYYGILARQQTTPSGGSGGAGIGAGFASEECMRLARYAWINGVALPTQTVPP